MALFLDAAIFDHSAKVTLESDSEVDSFDVLDHIIRFGVRKEHGPRCRLGHDIVAAIVDDDVEWQPPLAANCSRLIVRTE